MTSRNWSDVASRIGSVILIITGTLIFLLPAIINGYPLVYSDTSTYIASGFTLQPPVDRPIMYGLFLRFTSLNGVTLWSVVVLQGLLLSMLLYRVHNFLADGFDKKWKSTGYLLLVTISSLSGAGWAASHLMPDIFTSIMVLTFLLIILEARASRSSVSMYILFGISVAVHFSHVPISLALLLIAFLVWIYQHRRGTKPFKLRILAILLGIILLGYGSMASSSSKSRHVFLMGAFIEQGIIGEFLQEHCEERPYKLCAFRDSLPAYSWQFIWEPSSPLYQLGGWKETREEFSEIINQTFTSPKYIWIHVKASLRETGKQVVRFQTVQPLGVAPNREQLRARIFQYIPSDGERYDGAIQNKTNLLALVWLNPVQLILIFLSLALLSYVVYRKQAWKIPPLRMTALIILSAILLNAFISGTFANAIDRMGNKMIWLLPMVTILLLIDTNRSYNRE